MYYYMNPSNLCQTIPVVNNLRQNKRSDLSAIYAKNKLFHLSPINAKIKESWIWTWISSAIFAKKQTFPLVRNLRQNKLFHLSAIHAKKKKKN